MKEVFHKECEKKWAMGLSDKNSKRMKNHIFYTSCMYAYQPIFRECFGKEITKFEGRVTMREIEEFRNGISKFADKKYSLDHKRMAGYIDNISHDQLVNDLNKLCDLMESKEVRYLFIS
ncbi:hypothetical protein [Paenibacillus pini]|nr:hypothetical protein [Paenibacillus pini]